MGCCVQAKGGSVAVSRKKKVAVDAIKSVEKGQFPISFFGVRNAI